MTSRRDVAAERVAVVGRGCVVPGALDADALVRLLFGPEAAITRVPEGRWRVDPSRVLAAPGESATDRTYCDRGGYVEGFEPAFDAGAFPELAASGVPSLLELDPLFRWALFAGGAALDEAGLRRAERASLRGGLVLGNLSFPTAHHSRYAEAFFTGEETAYPPPEDRYHSSLPARLCAAGLGLTGAGALCLDAACASSLYAVEMASRWLLCGRADVMLAGAVNCTDDLFIHVGFTALEALSRSGRSRPFHPEADGLVPAEGASLVALMRLSDALAQGRRVLGVIRGVGLSNDGRRGGLLSPDGDAQVRAMRSAYAQAGLDPAEVGYLECHATGTQVGDRVELESVGRVFGDAPRLLLGSFKGHLGHPITAAGAVGLIRVLGALDAGLVPPTLHLDAGYRHPALEGLGFHIPTEPVPWPAGARRVAAVSAFGFGGNNAHLVVEAFDERAAPLRTPPPAVRGRSPEPARIAIVGVGLRAGSCATPAEFMAALSAGQVADRALSQITLPLARLRFAPADLEQALGQQTAILAAAFDAIQRPLPKHTGVLIGMQCDPVAARCGLRLRRPGEVEGVPPLTPASVLGAMPNLPANRISRQFDLEGPSFTLSADELSGVLALEEAAERLRRGDWDAAVVGAVDLGCEALHQHAAARLGDERPPGDAAVVLLMMRQADAEADDCEVVALLEAEPPPGAAVYSPDPRQGRSLTPTFGHAHAASGLLHVAAAALGREPARVVVEAVGPVGPPHRVEVGLRPGPARRAPSDGPPFQQHANAHRLVLSARPPDPVCAARPRDGVVPGAPPLGVVPGAPPSGVVPGAPRSGVVPGACGRDEMLAVRPSDGVPQPATSLTADGVQRMPSPPHPALAFGAWVPACPAPAQAQTMAAPPELGRWSEVRSARSAAPPSEVRSARSAAQTGSSPLVPAGARPMRTRHGDGRAGLLAAAFRRTAEAHRRYVDDGAAQHAHYLRLAHRTLTEVWPSAALERPPSAVEHSAVEQSAVEQSAVEQSAVEHSADRPAPPAPAVPVKAIAAASRASGATVRGLVPGTPPPPPTGPVFDRGALEVHAGGRVSDIFGAAFADQDAYALQVRMPEPPLLLADRVTGLAADAHSMGRGTVWTETDVSPDAWYLDLHRRMPAGVMVEAGQADLFLISYLGADRENRGERAYRLLGCKLTYHRSPPRVGETLCFDIHVDGHAAHGQTRLFFFHSDCHIDGRPALTVRAGQAGFFTEAELAESAGIVDGLEACPKNGQARVDPPRVEVASAFDAERVGALIEGDLVGCFGDAFRLTQAQLDPPRIPGGQLRFFDAVEHLDPAGGPYRRGVLRAVRRIRPDDWFFAGHFLNDPCMPGTLMFDGCQSAMAFYLIALGFSLDRDGYRFEPIPHETYDLRCRGQVTPDSRELTYEVFVQEVHDGPVPRIYADLLCSVDGLKAFFARRMGVQLVPDTPLSYDPDRVPLPPDPEPVAELDGIALGRRSLMHCAIGGLSQAFGPRYARFDGPRRAPRLPGPPYHFVSRVRRLEGQPFSKTPGLFAEFVYDIPPGVHPAGWPLALGGDPPTPGSSEPPQVFGMPFCVWMEVALQPCGWLASVAGCALEPPEDLCFRNLDGEAEVLAPIPADAACVVTRARLTSLDDAGSMILVGFDVENHVDGRCVLRLQTRFGFFQEEALREQKGLPVGDRHREALTRPGEVVRLKDENVVRSSNPLGLLDRLTLLEPGGGRYGLGRVRAESDVHPGAWFFRAHFFEDPVQPGSIGVEAMLELLRHFLVRTGATAGMRAPRFWPIDQGPQRWSYRGQVVPRDTRITITMDIKERVPVAGGLRATAEASLWVAERRIYEATLSLRVVDGA